MVKETEYKLFHKNKRYPAGEEAGSFTNLKDAQKAAQKINGRKKVVWEVHAEDVWYGQAVDGKFGILKTVRW